jgi:hypothetical protein
MDAQQIVARLTDNRKMKAMQIAETPEAVTRLASGTWEVRSQSDASIKYLVTRDLDQCTCPDFIRSKGQNFLHDVIPCKHLGAVCIFILAQQHARKLAAKHGLTLEQVAARILADLCQPLEPALGQKLAILRLAAESLAQQPEQIQLVVRFHTSGGKYSPTLDGDGELVEIVENGKTRQPRATSHRQAVTWLEGQGFQPEARTWIEPAGAIRRRKETYSRAAGQA